MAWRELDGNGGSYSNNVSTHGFEMCDVEGRKTETNEIMRMTDVSVSYQDDQRSDASSRPIRGRAED
jgi:hypothetical protein